MIDFRWWLEQRDNHWITSKILWTIWKDQILPSKARPGDRCLSRLRLHSLLRYGKCWQCYSKFAPYRKSCAKRDTIKFFLLWKLISSGWKKGWCQTAALQPWLRHKRRQAFCWRSTLRFCRRRPGRLFFVLWNGGRCREAAGPDYWNAKGLCFYHFQKSVSCRKNCWTKMANTAKRGESGVQETASLPRKGSLLYVYFKVINSHLNPNKVAIKQNLIHMPMLLDPCTWTLMARLMSAKIGKVTTGQRFDHWSP